MDAQPTKKPPTAKLHHIEYYVNGLEQAREFWSWLFGIFGWVLKETWNQGFAWTDPETGTYLVFVQVKDGHLHFQNNRQAQGLNHIAMSVKSKLTQAALVRDLK